MRGHSFRMPTSFQSRLKLTHSLHFTHGSTIVIQFDFDQQEVRTNRTTTTRLNPAIEKKGNSDTFGQFAFLIDGYECILRCRWRWKKISKTVSGISSNFLEYHLIWHTENESRGDSSAKYPGISFKNFIKFCTADDPDTLMCFYDSRFLQGACDTIAL